MKACDDCLRVFSDDEVVKRRTTYEAEYGVSNLFPNSTPMTKYLCPFCGSDEITEAEQCEKCLEYFHPDNINWNLCVLCEKEV